MITPLKHTTSSTITFALHLLACLNKLTNWGCITTCRGKLAHCWGGYALLQVLWPRCGHRPPTKALQTSRSWANFSTCPHVRPVIVSLSRSRREVFSWTLIASEFVGNCLNSVHGGGSCSPGPCCIQEYWLHNGIRDSGLGGGGQIWWSKKGAYDWIKLPLILSMHNIKLLQLIYYTYHHILEKANFPF